MGPAISPCCGNEPSSKNDRAKSGKNMTAKEFTILDKVFYKVSDELPAKNSANSGDYAADDVPRRVDGSASPSECSKAGSDQVRVASASMQREPLDLSVSSSSSSQQNPQPVPLAAPSADMGQISSSSSMRTPEEQERITRRLWEKYPTVMEALERPALWDTVVLHSPKEARKERRATPPEQKPGPIRRPRKRRAAMIKKEESTSSQGESNESFNPAAISLHPQQDPLAYQELGQSAFPQLFPEPSFTRHDFQWQIPHYQPGPSVCSVRSPSSESSSSFYSQTLSPPTYFNVFPSVDTLLSYPHHQPLPVLHLDPNEIEHITSTTTTPTTTVYSSIDPSLL